MPAHAEQCKLIGLSPNHREKSSLKTFLWETKSGTSSSAAVLVKKKKKKKGIQKEQIKHC